MSRVDSVLAAVSIAPAASSPGATWQPPNECHLSREVRGISVDPTDPSRVYAGSFYAAQPPDHCASELPPVEA